jgi:hypothetical protein
VVNEVSGQKVDPTAEVWARAQPQPVKVAVDPETGLPKDLPKRGWLSAPERHLPPKPRKR